MSNNLQNVLPNAETQYLSILDKILNNGIKKPNRTGIDTLSIWGTSIEHDYNLGFPLLTTKKMFIKGIIHELLWFLKGTEDASYLIENGVRIWDEWMKEEDGKKVLPHTYGVKWRNFHGVDQIAELINGIKVDPDSRRHIVSAWDAANVKNTALAWCHILMQINIDQDKYKPEAERSNDGKLGDISIAVVQRSSDFFLGVPYNIASYSFLLYMIAAITNYRPKKMYYTFHDSHIYVNHIEQCKLQISREPYVFPQLNLNHRDNIDDFIYEDFSIINYSYHPTIKGEVAV